MHAIEVRDLTKTFGGKRALDEVSMTVRQGDVYGLLGPNGAGKTTTMRILLGLIPPDEGKVAILGKDVSAWGNDLKNASSLFHVGRPKSSLPATM